MRTDDFIFYPVHEHIRKRLPPNRAGLVSTLAVTFLLIVPAVVLLTYTTRQAIDATTKVQETLLDPEKALPSHALNWVRGQLPVAWRTADFSQPLRQGAEKIAAFIGSSFARLVKNLFNFFLNLFIVIFALFFMFRDGDRMVRGLRHLIPFDESIQKDMLTESRELIFASVAVALVIAGMQGVLGGMAFTIGGISAPVFWGVVIAFFSLVPVVGSALIWVPAALFLAFSGHWGRGIVIVAVCGGIAGVADNIVRPLLLRNRTQLNDLLLFISVLGGLEVFGLLGLVAGPTIVAAAMGVFRVYMDHRDQLAEHEV